MIRNRLLSVAGVLLSLGAVTTACGDGEADVGGGGQGGEGTGGSGTGGSGTGGKGTGGGGPLECPGEQVLCSAECVTLATDRANCGDCATVCGTGELCVSGACAVSCGAGLLACGVSCINPSSDPDFCGATDCNAAGTGEGEACGKQEACVNGACRAVDREWKPGARVDDGGTSVETEQSLAVDAAGNALVVYRQRVTGDDDLTTRTFARFYDAATETWLPGVRLDSSTVKVRNPRVAMSADGDGLAVWIEGPASGTPASVHAAHFDGATKMWATAVRIDTEETIADTPTVALDADGDGFIAWAQDIEGSPDAPRIFVSKWNGTAFSTATPLAALDPTCLAQFPRLAINGAGQAGLVWHEFWNEPADLLYHPLGSVYDGTNWSTPQELRSTALANRSAYGWYPDVGIDDAGKVTAVFVGDVYLADSSIYQAVYTPGGGWAQATLAEDIDDKEVGDPRLAVDRNGLATLVFQGATYIDEGGALDGFLEDYAKIYAARRPVGANWGASAEISVTLPGKQAFPQIGADANGGAIAFWLSAAGDVVSSRLGLAGWLTPQTLNPTIVGGAAFSPAIALTPSGNAFASWVQAIPGSQQLYVSKFF